MITNVGRPEVSLIFGTPHQAPPSVTVARIAVALMIGLTAVNFLHISWKVLLVPAEEMPYSALLQVGLVAALPVVFPLAALIGLSRGWHSAPIVISAMCGGSFIVLSFNRDLNSILFSALSVIATFAVWVSQSRMYAREMRAPR